MHHIPTIEGETGVKIDRTFELYTKKFGIVPPTDVWPTNEPENCMNNNCASRCNGCQGQSCSSACSGCSGGGD